MIQRSLISALALAVAMSPAAYAESGYNGEIDAALFYNSGDTTPGGSETLGSIYSRSSFDFSDRFGVQLDLGGASVLGEGFEPSYGLHLIYHIDEKFSLGAFANREGYLSLEGSGGENVDHMGIEFAYDSEKFAVDAYVGQLEYEHKPGQDFTFFGADVEVPLPNTQGLSLLGGYHDIESRDDYVYVGVEKDLNNGMSLGARYSRDDRENLLGLTLNYKFGKGSKFNSRGISAAFKGDHN